jgi:hypothetical protein
MDMAIVGDVDQKFLKDLVLNPAVEDRDDGREIGIRIIQVKLYVYVLQLDCGFFFKYGSHCSSISAETDRLNHSAAKAAVISSLLIGTAEAVP